MMTWIAVLAVVLAAPFVREVFRRPMDETARSSAPGQFADLPLGVTHYQWHGGIRGPVVVCIHGLTTPSPIWYGLIPGLTGMGFRVLTYDLYGRGYSDRPSGRQDADFFVDQLEQLLDHLGVTDDVTLFGHSMGGTIATSAAWRWPERVRRLMLLAPAGMFHAPDRLTWLATRLPILGDWLMLSFFPRYQRRTIRQARRSDVALSVPEIHDVQLRELGYRGYVPAVLSSLRCALMHWQDVEHSTLGQRGIPVFAIWGDADEVIPIRAMGRLAQWNRDAHQASIPDAGHALAVTHSDAVVAAIRAELVDQAN